MIFYTYFDDTSTWDTQISATKNINSNQKDNPILSRVLLTITPQIKQWGLIPDHTGNYTATLPVAVSEGILVLAGDTGEATICYGAQFKTTKSIAIYSSQQTWAQSTQYVAIGKI